MNLFHAIILGIIEGITEFLPISSTGHLILTAKILGLTQTEFLKSFEIAIQVGAILAVLVLYWKKLLLDLETFKRVLAAFVPTAIIGFLLHKLIKKFLIGNIHVVLGTFFVGGVILILFEKFHKEENSKIGEIRQISYGQSILIGLCQSLAVIPGVSRSAATIVGGLAIGIQRKTIVEFSFLLAIPTLVAATVLDLLKSSSGFSFDQWELILAGALVSFIVAIFSIRVFLAFVSHYSFKTFGWYRIVIALLFWNLF